VSHERLPSIRLLVRTGSHLGSFAAADMTRRRARRSGQPFSVNANKYCSTSDALRPQDLVRRARGAHSSGTTVYIKACLDHLAANEVHEDIALQLLDVQPTTMAGLIALLRYSIEFEISRIVGQTPL
jgi:hypothetical protein